MDNRGTGNIGPIISSDERKSTDLVFLLLFILYLIFWCFMGYHVVSQTKHELSVVDPEDDSMILFQIIGMSYAASEDITQLRFVGCGEDQIILRDSMRSNLKKHIVRMTKDLTLLYKFANVVAEILGLTGYLMMIVCLSEIVINALKMYPRVVVYVSLIIFYGLLIIDVVDSSIKLAAAVSLEHPSPVDHVIYLTYDLAVVVFVLVVTLLFSRKIFIATILIKEGSKAVLNFPLSLYLVPVAELLFVYFLETIFGTVANSVMIIKNRNGSQGEVWFFQLYNLFGYLWFKSFIAAIVRIILSRNAAIYYWSDNKEMPSNATSESVKIALRYHMGTSALGSGIMSVARWAKLVTLFGRLIQETKGFYSKSSVFQFLSSFFQGLVAILVYINKNAYIFCAVHGTNYLKSAKEAIGLIFKNIPLALLTCWITIWVCRFCATIVAAGSAVIGASVMHVFFYDYLSFSTAYPRLLEYASIMTVIIFFVVEVAIETIFLCALEDFDRNDGSAASQGLKNAMLNS